MVEKYYNKLIPLSYAHDRIGLLGVMKKIISLFIVIVGFLGQYLEVRYLDMMCLKL